ncbi:MAG: InlB B-repeat-containing protein, partial [Oscillospiraceae bacterium]|nr:InlB B-repeat-containing protein [Oscillospiraceae bacterium]
ADAGDAIEYTAPDKTGYTFLYWAQGLGEYKKIVSSDKKLSLKAEKGAMWLTAVYSDNSLAKTEVVFYNANGDEISRSQYEQNEVITLEDIPSMAGFGTATGWTLDTDGVTYTAEDKVKASGRLMRFVAEYPDEPSERFDITVVDGTAVNGIADDGKAVYGETVTVTAASIKGIKRFNYWEKDGEIVSFDLSYSFKPYKDTTVTAVYNDSSVADTIVRKIIVGTRPVGNKTAAVAEFIGISDAVEKGILFGTNLDNATHKISMKTEGDTFSVIDDVDGDAIGYAILSNGNAIYSK